MKRLAAMMGCLRLLSIICSLTSLAVGHASVLDVSQSLKDSHRQLQVQLPFQFEDYHFRDTC